MLSWQGTLLVPTGPRLVDMEPLLVAMAPPRGIHHSTVMILMEGMGHLLQDHMAHHLAQHLHRHLKTRRRLVCSFSADF